MKLQFAAIISQIQTPVKLSSDVKYQEIICRLDDTQSYKIRCQNELLKEVKKMRIGQKYVITARTFTQNRYISSTGKTQYNILLIAEKLQYNGSIICTKTEPPAKSGGNGLELAS